MRKQQLIAVGVGLFGYGALWGWAIGGDLLEQKYNERLDTLDAVLDRNFKRVEMLEDLIAATPMTEEELSQIHDDVQTMKKEDRAAGKLSAVVPVAIEPESVVGTTPDGRVAYSDADDVVERPIPPGETPAETEHKLRNVITRYVSDPDELHDFESRVLAHENSDKRPPFVISQEQFAMELDEEGEAYDKLLLTYYAHDRVVVNDDDEAEDDVANLIGWQSLSSFGGDDNGDPDVVYVRNDRLRTDFEVVRETENKPPLHVIYGMSKDNFNVQRAAGTLKIRPEDE